METIQTKIKSIAEQIGISYIYDDWTTGNVRIGKTTLPVMVNVLPVSGGIRYSGYNIIRSAQCMIAFLDKADFDFDGEQNDTVVERMQRYAIAFVKLANESSLFEPVGDEEITIRTMYDTTDDNLTGVMLELTLRETEGVCVAQSVNDIING